MDFRNEIEEILKIQDPKEKTRRIEDIEDSLRDNRSLETEDIGEAASILLKFASREQNNHVKESLFSLLLTAVSWHEIDKYIDWDFVIAQIPHLAGYTLLYALEIPGWSREKKYIPFLEEYLNYPDVRVQIAALDAIAQLWWDISDKSDEMKKKMKIEAISHIRQLLNNPKKHHVSDTDVQRQLLQVQREFIVNMRDWFEMNESK